MGKKHKEFFEHLQGLVLQFTRQANDTIYNNYKEVLHNTFLTSFNDKGFHHDQLISRCCNMKVNYDNTRIAILRQYFDERMECKSCTKKVQCAMLSKGRTHISIPVDIKFKKFQKIINQLDITDYYGICAACQNSDNNHLFNAMHNIKPRDIY